MSTLQDLNDITADITVASPDEYVDSSFGLLPEGVYDFILKSWEVGKNRDGQFNNMIRIEEAEALDPQTHEVKGTARQIAIFTTTYERRGVVVSGLGDLIRGIDATRSWKTMADAGAILNEAVDRKLPIRVKVIWEAYDRAFFEREGGPLLTNKSAEQKDLRKRSTTRGMQNFRALPDGSFSPETTGPSGQSVEARLVIDRVVPSSKRR